MGERLEVLMRIIVSIVSGIILTIWRVFIVILAVINLVYTLIMGKRLKELARLCEIWNTQLYIFVRYLIFVTNERPFPFNSLTKNISKFKK